THKSGLPKPSPTRLRETIPGRGPRSRYPPADGAGPGRRGSTGGRAQRRARGATGGAARRPGLPRRREQPAERGGTDVTDAIVDIGRHAELGVPGEAVLDGGEAGPGPIRPAV